MSFSKYQECPHSKQTALVLVWCKNGWNAKMVLTLLSFETETPISQPARINTIPGITISESYVDLQSFDKIKANTNNIHERIMPSTDQPFIVSKTGAGSFLSSSTYSLII